MRKNASSDFQTTVDVEGATGSVTIDAVDEKGEFLNQLQFNASLVTPDYKSRPLSIEQTGPGRYEGSFDAAQLGSYLVSVSRHDQSGAAPDVSVVNIPYPPEYKSIDPNTDLLKELASESGGRFDPKSSEVFGRGFKSAQAHVDLWRLLVLISALLLPLDIAVRRLAMSPEQVFELLGRLKIRVPARLERSKAHTQNERVESVSALLQAKKERKIPHIADIQEQVTKAEAARPLSSARRRPSVDVETGPSASEGTNADESYTSKLLAAKRRSRDGKD